MSGNIKAATGKLQNPICPVKLGNQDTFNFVCHKKLSCFNECCKNMEIYLTPYDILVMRKSLDISSDEFLSKRTEARILDKTNLPFILLKMKDDGSCPFMSEEGCTIYDDRPLACRYYPIGYGLFKNDEKDDSFYYMVKENVCKGHQTDKKQSIEEWKRSQGIEKYDIMNSDWFDIVLTKKLKYSNVIPDKKTYLLYITAAYDIDAFRRFVFQSNFISQFRLSEKTAQEIKSDDESLLKFAHQWLKTALFGKKP